MKIPHALFAVVLRSKIQAKLLYRLPVNPYPPSWLESLEQAQTAAIKKRFHLPRNFQTNALYLPTSKGGLGFPSLVTNDKVTFINHYNATLNEKNPTVRRTTRDRVINEWTKEDHALMSPYTCDPHRFLGTLFSHEATLVHKPHPGHVADFSLPIWSLPLRQLLNPHIKDILRSGCHSLHHICTPDNKLRTREDMETEYRIILASYLHAIMARKLTVDGTNLIPSIRKEWTRHIERGKDMDWSSILGDRISSEEPLEAWTDGSYMEGNESQEESAGLSLTIYRGTEIIKTLQLRVPGQQTIQRAEMLAAVLVLKSITPDTSIDIFPDSLHVVSHATQWYENPTKDPNAATNYDLVALLHEKQDARQRLHTSTTWTKVKSHSGLERNDREDELSNYARTLVAHPNFDWLLIPPDTYVISHNNTPIFDINTWITETAHDHRLTDLKARTSSWWHQIPNVDHQVSCDARRTRWRDSKASFLAQARTGSLRVAATLFEWNNNSTTYASTPTCPHCDQDQTIQHIPQCHPQLFDKTILKYNKIAPTINNKKTRFMITLDEDIFPLSPTNLTISIGHYGAIHTSVRATLAKHSNNQRSTFKILRNIVDEVTQLTQHEWKFACDTSHRRPPPRITYNHSNQNRRIAAPIIPPSPTQQSHD